MTTWKRTLGFMVVAQFLTAVGFSMIFPFLPTYVAELGSSSGLSPLFLVGAVFSVQGVTMMLASPVWGTLADRWGRKPMVQRALLGGAAVVLLMAFARSAEDLVVLRAVQGLVTGVVSAANALVASVAPRNRTGYALGALQTALWSGVALGPLIGGVMADLYGYRAAFLITAGLLLIGGVLVQFGVHEQFERPADRGGFRHMVGGWKQLVTTPGVTPTYLARFSAWLGRGVLVPILPLFVPFLLAGERFQGTFTGLVIGVASFSGTLSALWLGNLGDRVGHRPILLISTVVASAAYLPMAWVTEPWQLLALNLAAGAAFGGIMPSLSALLADYTERGRVGAAFGIDNAMVAASRALAPLFGVGIAVLVGGWLGEEAGYRAVFLGSTVIFALTLAVTALWLPALRSRRMPQPASND